MLRIVHRWFSSSVKILTLLFKLREEVIFRCEESKSKTYNYVKCKGGIISKINEKCHRASHHVQNIRYIQISMYRNLANSFWLKTLNYTLLWFLGKLWSKFFWMNKDISLVWAHPFFFLKKTFSHVSHIHTSFCFLKIILD